ncbi:MAG: preprotein translocase subunit SecG [Bacteroidaceae bacterium]|nr:preprotein translocase subunit SecG [Bacteroidaceae bacterium]
MYTLIIVLVILASILMCGIVLIQESKGGGLASGFSSSNQIMGVRKTTDFLEKATWALAIIMVVLSVVSSAFVTKTTVEEQPLTAPITTQTDANNVQSFPAATQQQAPAQNTSDKDAQAPAETPAPAPAN